MNRATKNQLSQNESAFQKFMKRPRSKFHAVAVIHSKVIRSKKVKIYH